MFVSAFVLFLHVVYCSGDHWSYSHQELWPATCEGTRQSPIAINHNEAIDVDYNQLQFSSGYYKRSEATLTNTGHTVEIKLLDTENPPKIRGGGLPDEYVLESFHFHWGAEHVIDGYRYPLEGHFVHYAQKYGNLTNALNYPDGVAVLGVFYEITQRANTAFNVFSPAVPEVAHDVNNPVTLQRTIVVADYLPEDTHRFYRYQGSLTTPDCNEAVIWTLFTQVSSLSENQLEKFTQIWTEDDEPLETNYRELQSLNGREVYYVEPKTNKIMWK